MKAEFTNKHTEQRFIADPIFKESHIFKGGSFVIFGSSIL